MNPIVAPVKNVMKAQISFNRLLSRPMGVPAMGLWHGDSGRGKSTTATYVYNQIHGVYVSVRDADSVASLMRRLVEECGGQPRYAKNKNIEYVIEHLSMNELPLFIDEADYLMDKKEMLNTVRDIYDATEVPMILIGMDQIARRIQSNRQFFNRISEWVEFKPADLEDVKVVAKSMIGDEIVLEEELLDRLRKSAHGEMRRIVIGINKIHNLAKVNELDLVTSKDWGNEPFHGF
ncbi:ATP-binding protein [Photobacterium sp. WH24]|uniref:AAA family ATPase n=1 Tax=Photobacterium sp. WH24 TaxID=2827237 RepID=UPI001C493A0E|nr:ATP-binding protein [Photobacterium sp. WH24]MBV7262593.1 ATP-binding protein [Photobacterium sp. WH24]